MSSSSSGCIFSLRTVCIVVTALVICVAVFLQQQQQSFSAGSASVSENHDAPSSASAKQDQSKQGQAAALTPIVIGNQKRSSSAMKKLDPTLVAQLNQLCNSDYKSSLESSDGGRFLLMDFAPPSSMGLNNQLISYSEALFLAFLSGRVLVLPQKTTPQFSTLVDLTQLAAAAHVPCGVRVMTFKEFSSSSSNNINMNNKSKKKPPKLQLPARTSVLGNSVGARKLLTSSIAALASHRTIRVGNTFWHVPLVEEDVVRVQTTSTSTQRGPADFFSSLRFATPIRDRATHILETVVVPAIRKMGGPLSNRASSFIAFHARFEPDVVGFSSEFKPPSPKQLSRFLERCVLPRIQSSSPTKTANVKVVYVVGGTTMSRALLDVLVDAFATAGLTVLWKNGLLLGSAANDDVANSKQQPQHGVSVTNHVEAAVDAAVAERARLLIGADYSTFTKAIQLRRCSSSSNEERTQQKDFEVRTYDHKLRYLRDPSSHSCDIDAATPWATTPHSFMPGFVRASKEEMCPS